MELAAEQSQWRQGLDGCGTKNAGGPCEGVRNVGKGDLGSPLKEDKRSLFNFPYSYSFVHLFSASSDALKHSPHILDVNTQL